MTSFFLCDLTHTTQGVNAEFIPYPIGCIKSYFHSRSSQAVDIRLFKYPEKVAEEFLRLKPAIVGFSNYMWNLDVSYTLAKAIKEEAPDTLVVFGGPNYPLEPSRQEAWLRAHPAVDIHVVGEGEATFLAIAEAWLESRSVEMVKRASIRGAHSLVEGRLSKVVSLRSDGYDDAPRIADLNGTPSPYLRGYLDDFLYDPILVPLMECNRGCPFTCAFCVDGIGARSKVYKVGIDRLREELIYIAERYSGKYLILADTNFGMYKEDVEFCKVMADVRSRYDYPHHLQVSTGKNQKERVIECADLLQGALRFAASVQSLDEDVLRNTKRSNISFEQLIQVSARVSNTEASTYSEVILALPGDSRDKHMASVTKLIDVGFNQIRLYTFMVLDGSELSTDAMREKFRMKTRFRVVPRSFGAYRFGDRLLPSVEIEEVCVENDTLPFADYLECRRFALTVTLFYNDRVFFELTQFIKELGIPLSRWVQHIHDMQHRFPAGLRAVYDRFVRETQEELATSREELEDWIKANPTVLASYVEGERGNNVLFNTQAAVYVDHMEDLHDVAFDSVVDMAAQNGIPLTDEQRGYLDNLKRYSLHKKRRFIDLETEQVVSFDYDFVALEAELFEAMPAAPTPTTVRFFFEPWQKELFADQFRRQGTSRQGLGKVFSRIPIKKTQRRVAREDEAFIMSSSTAARLGNHMPTL